VLFFDQSSAVGTGKAAGIDSFNYNSETGTAIVPGIDADVLEPRRRAGFVVLTADQRARGLTPNARRSHSEGLMTNS